MENTNQGQPGQASFRAPMRRVLWAVTPLFLVAVVAVTVFGGLLGGADIAWGVGLGLGVAWIFFTFTVVVGLLAAGMPNGSFVAAVMAAWILKVIALLVFMSVIKDSLFYSKVALFISLAVGAVVWLTTEVIVVLRARVPYVEVTS